MNKGKLVNQKLKLVNDKSNKHKSHLTYHAQKLSMTQFGYITRKKNQYFLP